MNLVQTRSIRDIEHEIRRQILSELHDYAMNFSLTGPGGQDYVNLRAVERIVMGDYR